MVKRYVILALMLCSLGCETESDDFPQIGAIVVPYREFVEMKAGEVKVLRGGYGGILLYKCSINTFVAYDASCRYEYPEVVTVEPKTLPIVECPVCASQYQLAPPPEEAFPTNGSKAHRPLHQYVVSLNGDKLVITDLRGR